jgi:hypothetical protein
MKKTLVGLGAALLIAAGGYFGFQVYLQHRATAEVDAALEQIRSAGGKASHGKVSYDLWNRTLTIADIVSESAAQPPVTARIANLTASGVSSTSDNRFSADLVEVADCEFSMQLAAPAVGRTTYKMPRITAKDLSGPSRMELPAAAASSPLDVYRSLITQFVALSASSIAVPTISAKIDASPTMPGGAEFVYSQFIFDGIKGGKIASARVDEVTLMMTSLQAGKADKMTGRMAGFSTIDFDANTVAALLDPQKAKDDNVQRVYRQISAGAYEVSSTQGVRMRIDGFTLDDVGVRPSLVQVPDFLALLPRAGAVPTPAQMREMVEKTAKLYEGLYLGESRMRGLSVETPQGPLKMSAIRFNLDRGKSDFVFEGLEGRAPTGPFKVGRFALKSFDMPDLLRLGGQVAANPGQPPSPDKALALFRLIAGIEVKDVTAPFKDGRKQVSIDTISLNWDQLIGSIPTRAHLVTKMTSPLDPANPALLPLLVAGMDKAAIDADIGAAWSEGSGTFALDPFRVEISDLLKASVRLSLANVPRGVFSTDPLQAMQMAAQFEAGTLELSLRDLGAVDILVAQQARAQGIGRDAARSAIVDSIKAFGEKVAANPDTGPAVDALVSFVTTPRQTLTVKLTPLGKVQAMQLLDLLKTDPAIALAQFRIEASTGL